MQKTWCIISKLGNAIVQQIYPTLMELSALLADNSNSGTINSKSVKNAHRINLSFKKDNALLAPKEPTLSRNQDSVALAMKESSGMRSSSSARAAKRPLYTTGTCTSASARAICPIFQTDNASSAESSRFGMKRPALAKSALKMLPTSITEIAWLAQPELPSIS